MKGKKKTARLAALILIIAAACCIIAMAVSAGTQSDPLVSLSYLNGTFKSSVTGTVESYTDSKASALESSLKNHVTAFNKNLSAKKPAEQAEETEFESVTLPAGGSRDLDAGAQVLMISGSAAAGSAGLTDTTAGEAVGADTALTANHLYQATAQCSIVASEATELLLKE